MAMNPASVSQLLEDMENWDKAIEGLCQDKARFPFGSTAGQAVHGRLRLDTGGDYVQSGRVWDEPRNWTLDLTL